MWFAPDHAPDGVFHDPRIILIVDPLVERDDAPIRFLRPPFFDNFDLHTNGFADKYRAHRLILTLGVLGMALGFLMYSIAAES